MFLLNRQNNSHQPGQRGNVLWFILVAIFLLGALGALLARTGGQTDDTGDSEKATITASRLIRSATSIETTFQNLLMQGCSENTISFWQDDNGDGVEDSADPRYNPAAPTNRSCHIFDSKGGGATPHSGLDDTYNVAQFINVGTPARDLYMVVQHDNAGAPRGISREVCIAVNRLAGNNFDINALPQANMTTNPFTGSFSTGTALGDNGLELPMAGIKTGCNIDNDCAGAECNTFYSVIYAR